MSKRLGPTVHKSMYPRSTSFFCIAVFFGIQQALSSQDSMEFLFGNFMKLRGYSLLGNVTETLSVFDHVGCAMTCVDRHQCFSFNFGRNSSVQNLFTCELSNSLKAWDPQNLQSRPGFDLYEAESVDPCLSFPCRNGATCAEDKGNYICKCPVEIEVLPYVDGNCNLEMHRIVATKSFSGVFQSWAGGSNKIKFYEADRLCELQRATLATFDQLKLAWENGFGRCSHGWLADATIRFPMQKAVSGCGNKVGIIGSSTPRQNLESARSNVWCYMA